MQIPNLYFFKFWVNTFEKKTNNHNWKTGIREQSLVALLYGYLQDLQYFDFLYL